MLSKMKDIIIRGWKRYGNTALILSVMAIPLVCDAAWAANNPFESITPLSLESDETTMGQNIAKFLSLVRWVCLACGVGLFFVAGVKYMKDDNHQQGMGALPKAAIGLFVIAIGLSVVNYYIGTFGME